MYIFTGHGEMTKICIAGGGPAGVMAAIHASKNPNNEVYIFDKGIILNTLLPTGGGRCNLAYSEFNFKELAKYYPRGEKFLYSVFSRFCTGDTLEFFDSIGVKTYTQDDMRIFPVSDSSKEVKQALLKQIEKKNVKKMFEKILEIKKSKNGFTVITDKARHSFDKVVIASGGRGNGHKLAQNLGHNIKELKPALSSLITEEKDFASVSGISLKETEAEVFFENKKIKTLTGDLLFTHTGLSGPLIYKISSYCAYLKFGKNNPLKISLNLVNKSFEDFDSLFLQVLKTNAQKEIVNAVSEFVPKNLASLILQRNNIDTKIKAGQLSKKHRELLSKSLTGLVFHAKAVSKGEEIVTAGGVDLNEINPKTMESKPVPGLYFCGEVIDTDGLTGGFNLQNCWSTGFIAGSSLARIPEAGPSSPATKTAEGES